VLAGLDGRIDAVVDGGPCAVGIESTVVDMTGPYPVVLRPGGLARSALEACLGVRVELALAAPAEPGGVLRSPGLLERHYAPPVPLVLARDRDEAAEAGPGDVVIWCGPRGEGAQGATCMEAPADPEGYAAALYGLLWEASRCGASRIVAERPPDGPLWEGVHDRLRRASAPA
jgi:L-threonylcarbamoyladenylate synthase